MVAGAPAPVSSDPPMPDRDYSHRGVVDKLGIKPGHAVALVEAAGPLDSDLRERVIARAGRAPALDGDAIDVALVTADATTDAVAVLGRWRSRLEPSGGIWLLSPKRGQPGYVDQRDLIAAGLAAELVDNKSCSVSDTTSAMRFVIRKRDRPPAR
jgi:hypothetical protein